MATALRIKDHWAEQRLFLRRIIVSALIVAGLSGIVVARLAQLQINEYDYFSAQSQGNRIRVQPLPPTRGLIFDRHGEVLAENLPSYQLELTPEQTPDIDASLDGLATHGLIEVEDIPEYRALIDSHRRFDAIAIRRRLSDEEIARFAVQRPRFPGIEIRARLARNYRYARAMSHVIGYVGGISAAEKRELDPTEYAGTSQIGKVAVERSFEDELHGRVGTADVLVNAHGRVMEVMDSEGAQPGRDLRLTLDAPSQLAAAAALDGRRGAVVAIDPQNGEVLVLVSAPAFDANAISSGMTRREYLELQQDPDRLLFNRALRGAYPPGSTIKPIVAMAGMHHHVIDPDQREYCGGFYRLPGNTHRYRDWKPEGHGPVDMHDAIAESCDVYFYRLANELGIERMSAFLGEFGLGNLTGINVAGEKAGLLPTPGWKRTAFSRREDQVWFPGETVIAGIGQGYMLATPLQLAHATATLAARGRRFKPNLMHTVVDPVSGEARRVPPVALPQVRLDNDEQWDRAISAMNAVLQGERGTARMVGSDAPFTMAGKSGTAQVFSVGQEEEYESEEIAERMRDHALFVAFAPLEQPRIAVAVIIENGESGSRVAAPVAREVIETYLRDQL